MSDGILGVSTNEQGRFALPRAGRAIYLVRSGYLPVMVVRKDDEDNLQVTMVESGETERTVPDCGRSSGKTASLGHLRFPVLKGMKATTVADVDYFKLVFTWTSAGRRNLLSAWWGPQATSGHPRDSLIAGSTELTNSPVRVGQIDMFDIRGRKSDGTRWRYFGTIGFALSYEDVPAEASEVFDKVIDGACYKARP